MPDRHLSPQQLRLARQAKGLTQREAAERIGVIRNTVTRWESGDATPQGRALERAIEVYEVEVEHRLPETVGRQLLRRIDDLEESIETLHATMARLQETVERAQMSPNISLQNTKTHGG